MSIAGNKAVAQAFLSAVRDHDRAGVDRVLADDGQFWVMSWGWLDKQKFMKLIDSLWELVPGPATIDIELMTSEEDRVSIIGQGDMMAKSGKPYANTYHMLAVVRDGQICGWREYFNMALVADHFPR